MDDPISGNRHMYAIVYLYMERDSAILIFQRHLQNQMVGLLDSESFSPILVTLSIKIVMSNPN